VTTHSNGFAVIGAIEVKWLAKGGERGFLGKPLRSWPLSAEMRRLSVA
jgi:hypothetical protein